jgi:hypothetical protein
MVQRMSLLSFQGAAKAIRIAAFETIFWKNIVQRLLFNSTLWALRNSAQRRLSLAALAVR